ncbi:MAG TPA: TIGR03009 domain-containing protein [Urbifossiella sp.]|nr:TIGR03009 domain-containing protein [Urbifossiella sp.]
MRRLGPALAAFVAAAATVTAQPVPGQPLQPQPQPQPAPPDPRVNHHLGGWEKTMGALVNYGAEFELEKKNPVFPTPRKYGGSVLCMKPNFAALQIVSRTNKADVEAFLSNGKSVFHYEWEKKTITEFKLNGGGAGDNLMIEFLGGMKAAAAQQRFHITVIQDDPAKDKNYVVLRIQPLLARDKQEFVDARMALLAPTNVAKLPAYLPAVVWLQQPNGNEEKWELKNHKTNQAGVGPQQFQFQPVPGWQVQQAPAPPPPGAPRP